MSSWCLISTDKTPHLSGQSSEGGVKGDFKKVHFNAPWSHHSKRALLKTRPNSSQAKTPHLEITDQPENQSKVLFNVPLLLLSLIPDLEAHAIVPSVSHAVYVGTGSPNLRQPRCPPAGRGLPPPPFRLHFWCISQPLTENLHTIKPLKLKLDNDSILRN